MFDHGKIGIEFALETNLGLALGCHIYHQTDYVFDSGSQSKKPGALMGRRV
jgi:hypothetical protein